MRVRIQCEVSFCNKLQNDLHMRLLRKTVHAGVCIMRGAPLPRLRPVAVSRRRRTTACVCLPGRFQAKEPDGSVSLKHKTAEPACTRSCSLTSWFAVATKFINATWLSVGETARLHIQRWVWMCRLRRLFPRRSFLQRRKARLG